MATLTTRTELAEAPNDSDLVHIVDVSDTTDNASGTSKKITAANLKSGLQAEPSEGAFVDGDKTKLDGIETGADVTDATNVTVAGALMDSELTDIAAIKAASDASAATTTAGTDATAFVTPDGLAGSDFGKRVVAIAAIESGTAVAVADGTVGIPITAELNGYNVVDVQANVYTKGVTGTTDVVLRRQRGATDVDVLSTPITIGDEYYASDGTINTANDDLATGDMLFVDVDAVHSGTAPNGLSVAIVAQLP